MQGEDINADNIAEYFKKLSAEQQSQVARMIALWADGPEPKKCARRKPGVLKEAFDKGIFVVPKDINAYDEEAARTLCGYYVPANISVSPAQVDNAKERTLGLAKGLFVYDGLEDLDAEVAKMFEAS